MCYICNPYCGKCRPPQARPRNCTHCGAPAFSDEETHCRKCSAELPPPTLPEPRYCHFIREMCSNPCGKSATALDEAKKCDLHTPLPASVQA